MNVHQIIDGRSVDDIIMVKPDDEVRHAAELLARHRIGAVIVSGDGRTVDGIFSERDIVRALAATGAGCLSRQVGELMTRSVVACKPADSIPEVMTMMTDGRFRHMPVMEEGRLIGVVSIGDVVKARITEFQHENEALTEMIVGHG